MAKGPAGELDCTLGNLRTIDFGDFWGEVHYASDYRHNSHCERCEEMDELLEKFYRCIYGDDCDPRERGGDLRPMDREVIYICGWCINEVINGGGMDEDEWSIHVSRVEQDYEDDPINFEPPEWW